MTDSGGKTGTASIELWVGNTAPTVTFTWPPDGAFFDWGDEVAWSARVDDPEDGSTTTGAIAPAEVRVDYLQHDGVQTNGFGQTPDVSGTAITPGAPLFGTDAFVTLEASYLDHGAPGVGSAPGAGRVTLQPKCRQAEHYTSASVVAVVATNDPAGGGSEVAAIDHNDFISFAPMNLMNIHTAVFRVASANAGGRIEIRADAPGGPLLGTVNIPNTGGPTLYADANGPVVDPGGTREIFFVFLRNPGDTDLFRVNWICFHGPGATLTARLPRVAQVRAGRPANTVTVEFDDVMDAAALAAPANYTLTGATILGIAPGEDRKSVRLTTSPLVTGQGYVIGVSGVRDLAGDLIAPGARVPFKISSVVLAINAGGAAYTGADGTQYLGDQFFSPSTPYTTGAAIAGTADDPVYHSQRYGSFTYSIPIVNGPYFVTLKFAELYWTVDGRRRFSATLEGNIAIPALDVHAQVGWNGAYDRTVSVNVADGVLDVTLSGLIDHAVLCGLVVIDAPPPFTDFASWQTFYFGSPTAPGASATDDFESDGQDNASEFSFGGDPTVADSAFFAPTLHFSAGHPSKLTLTYRKGLSGTNYRTKWSATLAPGSWSEAGVESEVYFAPTDPYRRSVPIPPGRDAKVSTTRSGAVKPRRERPITGVSEMVTISGAVRGL